MALGTAGSGKPTCCRRTWITKLLKLRPSARAKASNLCLRSTGQRIDADCLMSHVVAQRATHLQGSGQARSRHPYKRSARLPLRNPRLMRSGLVPGAHTRRRCFGMTRKPKRAALYVRVSTSGQTVENQVAELERVAEFRDWQVIGRYSDQGISGAKGRRGRPALDAMLRDAEK